MLYIIKRDGRKVPYSVKNIENAITKAFISVDKEITDEDKTIINDITSRVDKNIIDGKELGKEFAVEEIQDLVEKYLMQYTSRVDVAKAYILYREKRNEIREQKSELMRKINDKLNCTDIENSNANIDERSFGGREQEASAIIQKELAYQSMKPSVRNAIKDGFIYMHDLSKYKIGMHNCLQVDFEHVFKNGFTTRNGDVRPPKSLSSACQQVAVIFQCQSQVC